MGPRLQQQPVFCMETALKLVLWSDLVYEDAADGKASLGECLTGAKAKEDSLVGSSGSEQQESCRMETSESEAGSSERSSSADHARVKRQPAVVEGGGKVSTASI